MAYSRWATTEELMSKLTQISYDSNIKKSGIPMMFDDNHLYIKDDEAHTMVIGSTGSGKTQSITLPQLRLAIMAGESIIVHDVKGELFNILSGELKEKNYNTMVINLDNPKIGNNFNPLTLPYNLYKKGDKDLAVELLEEVGHYFCCSENIQENVDPFWNNSATSLFVGLTLYLFDNASEEEINIGSILNLISDFDKLSAAVKKYDRLSSTYIYLSNIILAPPETKSSIISVFSQNMRAFASKEALLKLLSFNNIDISNIQKEKTALFIISNNRFISRRLIPMIIDECYFAASNNNDKTNRLNIVIDDFENLIPIKDFNNKLTLARSYNIKYCIYIRSLLELRNAYGNEETEILKIVFGNIIYLLANDLETLEDISKLCGMTQTDKGFEPLVSIEDLKLLSNFEAIILIPRTNPIKTKLLPDYQIDWKFSKKKIDLKETINNKIKIYSVK